MIPLDDTVRAKNDDTVRAKRWKKDIRRRIPYGDKYFSNMTYTESRADDEDCCI